MIGTRSGKAATWSLHGSLGIEMPECSHFYLSVVDPLIQTMYTEHEAQRSSSHPLQGTKCWSKYFENACYILWFHGLKNENKKIIPFDISSSRSGEA